MGILDFLEYNGQMANVNFERTVVAISDYTFFVGSGTNTATEFYQDKGTLGGDGTGYVLRPDKDVQIVSIKDGSGNEKLQGDPITVSGGTSFVRVLKQPHFTQIKIRTTQTTTNIKLLVL